jgi:superfamily II DNA or RNA helicase
MALHKNQQLAIDTTLKENFASGVHFHATGTGKSWIALSLLLKFQQQNPLASNVMWICEQKSILTDQFDTDTLKQKGFAKNIKSSFLIFDYSQHKPNNWSQYINSAAIWSKPILIIINRAFLVSQLEYSNIKIPIHLIIHDECHSIVNTTTQGFYEYITTKYPDLKCIGFSATPVLTHKPYKRVITQYTIYDACNDGIIVPPRIMWFKSDKQITYEKIRTLCKRIFEYLPYKKVIIWCGMIQLCYEQALEWKSDPYFASWTIATDTSKNQPTSNTNTNELSTYEEFRAIQTNGLLFCAGKHREGSDIPYLDACLFIDQVESRNPKTFVQCVGRVLRKDPTNKKTYGLIIDTNAKSPIDICNRMNAYLQTNTSTEFPFSYKYSRIEGVQVNTMDVVTSSTPRTPHTSLPTSPPPSLTPDIVTAHFKRTLPESQIYKERLDQELQLFHEKHLFPYLFHALDILKLTPKIPHITRGSCGSSLVCYLLGISNIDPLKYNIQFARFLNEYRTTLPDIDFDFPHNLRDEVFLQIYLNWPGRVARISNHVYYHKKSALRKAVQNAGIHKQIPAIQIHDYIRKLQKQIRMKIYEDSKRLENTFRTYSLHCGGIVFYPEGVPKELQLKQSSTNMLSQIILNKENISKNKQFKIDILASRGLTQLYEALKFRTIDFEAHADDLETANLFARGDNIGVTLAESPLIRKTLIKLKPQTIDDIAKCLAIIRPAAKKAKTEPITSSSLIYDDDAITILQSYLNCSAAEADMIRRACTKADTSIINETLKKVPHSTAVHLKEIIEDLRKYSFCKSHAYSYAQLVWQLGYMKVHHPKEFWKATLKHCQSSYRKWVHLYEAKLAGVDTEEQQIQEQQSIYTKNRREKLKTLSIKERVKRTGTWTNDLHDLSFYPDCTFKRLPLNKISVTGLIANSRILGYGKEKVAVLFIGYGPKQYTEVKVKGKTLNIQGSIGITYIAIQSKQGEYETSDYNFW